MARKDDQSAAGSLIELVTIVAVALGLALAIQAFLVKPFRIPSESMVPTLEVGQRVLVDRVSGHFGEPERGDVIVFKPPRGADTSSCGSSPPAASVCTTPTEERSDDNFIKRVVAVGGDTITIKGCRVFVNGERQDEPFVRLTSDRSECSYPTPFKVPKDHLFMMGDNRTESADSRVWGPVPEKWVIGEARVTYWPPGRVGIL